MYRRARLPSRLVSAFALAMLAMLAAACSGKDPYNPGEPLGTFHVNGKLVQSTCGTVPDPWEFDVRLNHDASTLYWLQGGAPIKGSVDTAARAVLKESAQHDVRPADLKRQLPGCSVVRTDALDVVLSNADTKPNAGVTDTTSFAGTLAYSFAPTAESDCSTELTQAGGDFDTLPCTVQYQVTATRTKAPEKPDKK